MRLAQTAQFKKDIKKQIKRGKDPAKVTQVVQLLMSGKSLSPRCKNHPLSGNWKGRWDCHIEPDWVLIYRMLDDELRLERTGTHSDLF